MPNIITPYRQVLGLGLLAGIRSAAAPALAGSILQDNRKGTATIPGLLIPGYALTNALKIMAFAELLADKLPFTPNRTRPISIMIRCASGALVGAGIFNAAGKQVITGALIGATVAGASTFGSFFLRKALAKTGLGYFVSGVIEDAFVVGAAIKLARAV